MKPHFKNSPSNNQNIQGETLISTTNNTTPTPHSNPSISIITQGQNNNINFNQNKIVSPNLT